MRTDATTTATAPSRTARESVRSRLRRGVRDAVVIAQRNLRVLLRKPQLLVPALVQPIVLLLLFKYVFGGVVGQATRASGASYTDLLVPAVVFITASFGMAATATGMAADVSRGIVDRFRSLPMSRSAVLAGRVLAETANSAAAVVLIAGVGVAVGFRPDAGAGSLLAAFALAVGFGFAFSWIAVWIGAVVQNPEAAPAATLMWLFPLTFMSSAFVPVSTFPAGLEAFAKVNPITHFVDAIRVLTLHLETGTATVPTQRPVLQSLSWAAAIVAIVAPLAVRAYTRKGS